MQKLFLFLLIVTVACNKKPAAPAEITIKGDWVGDSVITDTHTQRAMFTIEDSSCTTGTAWGDFVPYTIIKDTFTFSSNDPQQTFRFKIIKLTADSLSLVAASPQTSSYISNYQLSKSDTVQLRKIRQKNTKAFTKIYFSSSFCYGTCPAMKLEIDSSGKIKYLGEKFTQKDGSYAGTLPEYVMSNLVRQLKNLPLDNINIFYEAQWTDDQTCCIQLEYPSKKIHTCVYGYNQEPIELRILFHKLLEIYKVANLKPDNAAQNELMYRDTAFIENMPRVIPPKIKD